MRLLIYLLAMLTGFSVADAARPAVAVPASVDAAVGQAYTTATVKVVEKGLSLAVSKASFSVASCTKVQVIEAFQALVFTTPVLRHDIILG